MAGDIFTERCFLVTVLAPAADRYNANPATNEVNLKNFQGVTFVVSEGAGGTGTATITVEECADAAGASPVAIAFNYQLQTVLGTILAPVAAAAAGYLTIAGADKMIFVHVNADQLSAGKTFVRLKLTETVNDPVAAGVIAVLWGPRYGRALIVSPLV